MSKSLNILSLSYGGQDTSACLMVNGKIKVACEQERFSLDKHSRLFPIDAISECLRIGGITIDDIDEIALCLDFRYYIRENYLKPALEHDYRLDFLINDIDRIKEFGNREKTVREKLNFNKKIRHHLHHLCHAASCYYPSGFDKALIVTVDGMGEKKCSLIAAGHNGKIKVLSEQNDYPDSLGLIYAAITFYLGYRHFYDEGIIMGLASWGNPDELIPGKNRSYYDVFCEIIEKTGKYAYRINRDWIVYHIKRDVWISEKFTDMFGPKRKKEDKITKHHMNIAAALQKRLEVIMLDQLKEAKKEFGFNKLCLAGGVALNCSMNGKIEAANIFDEIFVQPASADNGTVIGACYLSYIALKGIQKPRKEHNYYLGSGFTDDEIKAAFKKLELKFKKSDDIYSLTAKKIKEGKIVGWFQGGAEFGPRALGNRSILCKPYPSDMKDYINARVKFREYFRPFAPAVLWEHAKEYFKIKQESPHMLIACQVVEKMKDKIEAVVHVDGSCRVQTVKKENNPRFYKLLTAFNKITGCPVLLNTSFNVKGQPIVNTPEQALECFQSTNIDFLVIGDYFVSKNNID